MRGLYSQGHVGAVCLCLTHHSTRQDLVTVRCCLRKAASQKQLKIEQSHHLRFADLA